MRWGCRIPRISGDVGASMALQWPGSAGFPGYPGIHAHHRPRRGHRVRRAEPGLLDRCPTGRRSGVGTQPGDPRRVRRPGPCRGAGLLRCCHRDRGRGAARATALPGIPRQLRRRLRPGPRRQQRRVVLPSGGAGGRDSSSKLRGTSSGRPECGAARGVGIPGYPGKLALIGCCNGLEAQGSPDIRGSRHPPTTRSSGRAAAATRPRSPPERRPPRPRWPGCPGTSPRAARPRRRRARTSTPPVHR